MPDFFSKHDATMTWVFRGFVFIALIAQLWITSNFVSKAQFEVFQKEYKEERDRFQKEIREDVRNSATRSDLSGHINDTAAYSVRISNLERFEQEQSKRSSELTGNLRIMQEQVNVMSTQLSGNTALLSAYREDLRDVSNKMDRLLEVYSSQRSRQPSGN